MVSTANDPADAPLAGVRVLDLTAVIMGPTCTQILADHGADVVKIEPPEGDIMRHAGAKSEPGMGSMFVHVNRGKRSVVVDLKDEGQRAALLGLVGDYDVFIHNMRPEAAARLGLDYDCISARHPAVVYVELSGYGLDGPYAARPAFDDVIQAESGLAALLGHASDGEPRYLPALIADRLTGVTAAHHVLSALYRQQRTGKGCRINVAMFETMASFVLSDHLGGRSFEPSAGPLGYNRLLSPHRRPYQTRDGHVAVIVYNDKHWRSFFRVVGRPEILENDDRFATAAGRAENYDFIYSYISAIFAERDTAEWLRLLVEADIPCAPVNDLDDLIDDPHLAAVGFFRIVEDERGALYRLMPPLGSSAASAPPRRIEHIEHLSDVLGRPRAPTHIP